MADRCPHYHCATTTIEGLIQQLALSYLRHGYWWYVTGMIPARKDPLEVDHNILTKYDIRKDWRYIAYNKAHGIANLQYIRHGRFYLIMATKGCHEFKRREADRIRDARRCPILIPRMIAPAEGTVAGKRESKCLFDGYAVSYRRGGYLRKTPQERAEYRQAVEEWKRQRALGKRQPRPPRGVRDPKWHSCVEIERQTYLRLRASFLEIATRRSRQNLEYELTRTGYVPYRPVKRQLVRIIRDVNQARRVAGCGEQIPYRTVLCLKRRQLSPFACQGEQSALEAVV